MKKMKSYLITLAIAAMFVISAGAPSAMVGIGK
jgi:hypothetical protein